MVRCFLAFSGGFDLGLERAGFEIAWQVEIDEYCRKVLAKHWPAVPCHADIKVIDWRQIPAVDLVCGGFPCQPFSCAGKRAGTADNRYLWPEVVRCITALRPTWFLGENVPGLINLGFDTVLSDLENLGYEVAPFIIPACGVDAPHRRNRIWIMAHANRSGTMGIGRERNHHDSERDASQEIQKRQNEQFGLDATSHTGILAHASQSRKVSTEQCRQWHGIESSGESVAKANGERELQSQRFEQDQRRRTSNGSEHAAHSNRESKGRIAESRQEYREWPVEPAVGELVDGLSGRLVRFEGRVAKGIPHRVEKLKALGNSIVPKIAEALGRMILEAHATDL